MKLVEIKKLDLFANSLSISEGVERDHDIIIKLVDRNKTDLDEFGREEIRMVDRTQGGG